MSGTATTTQFVWDGSRRCEARDASGNLTTSGKQYFSLGQINFNNGTGTSYFYTKDHLGSIREMTNSAGSIVAQYGYDPFGVKSNIITETVPSDFQYAGYYLHGRSGLNLTLNRAYNPGFGRWINRDPIKERGGINLYEYVKNMPTLKTDPSGLSCGSSFDEPVDEPGWYPPPRRVLCDIKCGKQAQIAFEDCLKLKLPPWVCFAYSQSVYKLCMVICMMGK